LGRKNPNKIGRQKRWKTTSFRTIQVGRRGSIIEVCPGLRIWVDRQLFPELKRARCSALSFVVKLTGKPRSKVTSVVILPLGVGVIFSGRRVSSFISEGYSVSENGASVSIRAILGLWIGMEPKLRRVLRGTSKLTIEVESIGMDKVKLIVTM